MARLWISLNNVRFSVMHTCAEDGYMCDSTESNLHVILLFLTTARVFYEEPLKHGG